MALRRALQGEPRRSDGLTCLFSSKASGLCLTLLPIPRGDVTLKKGVWEPVRTLESIPTGIVSCPRCGVADTLENHDIEPDGEVTQMVLCTKLCGWQSYIKLEGWRDR